MKAKLKQTNVIGFSKNKKTGVVLNIDDNQHKRFLQEQEKAEQFNMIKNELMQLKLEFEELKKKVFNR